jgi:hypothetical protein
MLLNLQAMENKTKAIKKSTLGQPGLGWKPIIDYKPRKNSHLIRKLYHTYIFKDDKLLDSSSYLDFIVVLFTIRTNM